MMSYSRCTSSHSVNHHNVHTTTLLWLVAVTFPTAACTELFSATAKLPILLYTQKVVIDKLDDFIVKESEVFAMLTKLRDKFLRDQDVLRLNPLNYIAHPINAYMIIKRLTVDVNQVMEKLELFDTTESRSLLRWPTDDDLIGASQALTSLQATYQLSATDMADGKLGQINDSSPMSSGDCFGLARVLYNIGQHNESNMWFEETLKKMKSDNSLNDKARLYIYEFIANNDYKMGFIERSLKWLNEIIDENPEGKGNIEKRKLWEKELLERVRIEEVISSKENITEIQFSVTQAEAKLTYDALCRREKKIPIEVAKRLKCWYDTNGLYPKLAPFKVEEVYLNPDILVYHDVINNQEIEYIKQLGIKEMIRAGKTYTDANGEVKAAPYKERVSQVGSFDDSDAVIARVSRRAGRLSHLTLDTVEPVHVGCYGIGGFFSPHFDMLETRRVETFQQKCLVTEILTMTVLYYMSDVHLGGDTVFTELGVSIPPRKGSAVTWRNVLPSSEMDLRARHASCPVLLGIKWISVLHLQAAKTS